jgi:hypothetical protein
MRVLTLLALAAVLAGCGADSDEAAAPQPVTITVTEPASTTTNPPPTVEDELPPPGGECSTSTARTTLPQQELPAAVASVRQRIFDAAIACDYDELQRVALERGEGFTFSYGGETSAADFWRGLEESGETPMLDLVRIISIPHTRNETGSYAWPSAYDETPTDEDWQALVDAGLYTQAEVDEMKAQNTGYLGWRTAITPDGDWQFFVAGD